MNNVDIVDQRRRTSYTPRKERKVYMSFFHLMLDYAINNAYALYRWVLDNYHSTDNTDNRIKPKCVELYNFKTEIGMELCKFTTYTKTPVVRNFCTEDHVGTEFSKVNRKRKLDRISDITCIPNKVDQSTILKYTKQMHTMHLLRQYKLNKSRSSKGKKEHTRKQCFLHSRFYTDRRKNTMYGCTLCRVPLCPECFSVFHGMNVFDSWRKYCIKKMRVGQNSLKMNVN